KGAECTPALQRCLLHLSRGGGDAVVVRELDLAARAFVKDGFQLAEAKSAVTYLDEDTVLFGTDFGPGSMTASGYPHIEALEAWCTAVAGQDDLRGPAERHRRPGRGVPRRFRHRRARRARCRFL